MRALEAFNYHRHPLSAANAHRLQADRLVFGGEAVEQRTEDARPGHPERMAERDRAAVWIELLAEGVDAQLPSCRDDLRSEGFVDLHDVDVVDRHAGALERLARRLDRAEAHELRLESRDTSRDDPCQRTDPEILRPTVRHDHDRGRPVVEGTGIAGRYPPVFPEGRLQSGEDLHRGVGARPIVTAHRAAV